MKFSVQMSNLIENNMVVIYLPSHKGKLSAVRNDTLLNDNATCHNYKTTVLKLLREVFCEFIFDLLNIFKIRSTFPIKKNKKMVKNYVVI